MLFRRENRCCTGINATQHHSEAEIFRYVRQRKLIRPRRTIPKFVAWMVITAVSAFLSASVFYHSDIAHSCFWGMVAALLLTARRLVIAAVEIYQRYSPEDIRRSCMLMPTCSEYCILAVQKYGAVVGSTMTLYRLLFKCRGHIYREDWP